MAMDDLIERSFRGEATEEELARLAAWRFASPDHERQYRQLLRILAAAQSAGTSPGGPEPPSPLAIIARVGREQRVPSLMQRVAPWGIAAAAVALAVGSLWSRPAPSVEWSPSEVVTGASELATVQLRDGSVVRLAPSSRLRFDQSPEARGVSLDGRAFFAVARMPGRPFRVRTRFGEAQVLGTRFELAAGTDDLRLIVMEGTVALTATKNRVEVNAGEESGVRDGAAATPAKIEADSTPRWVGRFFAFQGTPLRDAVHEITRAYRVPIVISDSSLAEETITASFTDRSADQVMTVVCSAVAAQCIRRGAAILMTR